MNELNALTVLLPNTPSSPIDATFAVDGESSSETHRDGEDSSLDAALEFAAALLGAANGRVLPETGETLPQAQLLNPEPDVTVQIDVTWPGPASGDLQLPDSPALPAMTPEAIAALAALSQSGQGGLGQAAGPALPTAIDLVAGENTDAQVLPRKAPTAQEVRYANVPVTPDVPLADPKSLPAETVIASVASGIARTASDVGRRSVIARNGAAESLSNMLPASIGAISSLSAPSATSAGSVPTLLVQSHLSSEGFGREFSEKVGWVINAKLPSAQIKLNPEHLGPVEMSVEVEDKQARVHFTAMHGLTREAIEQSLPRLREALEQQGLSLQQADISDFSQRGDTQQDRLESAANDDNRSDSIESADDEQSTPSVAMIESNGLIDTFV